MGELGVRDELGGHLCLVRPRARVRGQDREKQLVRASCLCFYSHNCRELVGLWLWHFPTKLSHLPIILAAVKCSSPQKKKKKNGHFTTTQQGFCNLLPGVGELKDPAPHSLRAKRESV